LALTIRTVGLLAAAWPLTSRFGIVGAALATLVAEVPVQLVVAAMARRIAPSPFRGVPATLAASLVAGVIGLAIGWALDALLGPPFGGFVAGVSAGIVALGALWWLDRLLGLRLADQLVQAFPVLRRVIAPGSDIA
jgi:O-antigen/teichoic acid export membrane protein